ncbi:hypothetical protein EV426DRAFT_574060 [Tirmania nivea]|nr:hypothetical protein EV426DRAFT_574060 [Tirmania nivea]
MSRPGNSQQPSRPSSSSPRPLPRITMANDKQRYYPHYQLPYEFIPRIVLHNSKSFSLPQSTPLSSRSPSVASWCSFDSDYDDGLVIEEIDSDDDLNDSLEVIEGEYEDPPSDDDEFWDRWRNRQELNDSQNMIVNGFEDLSTSINSPTPITPAFSSPLHLFSPPTSPALSVGSKRSFVDSDTDEEETNKEDKQTVFGRRTRRRLTPKTSSSPRISKPTQVTKGFNVPTLCESDMEE